MRIPNTAEIFTFFAATGQLSGLSRLPGAGSEFSLAPSSVCDRSYTVEPGDICNSIAQQNGAPTYQIMCQNDQINGQCTNLGIGEEICLGRRREDCRETYVVKWPDSAQSIANQFNIPLRIFLYNNYCHESSSGITCPAFNDGTVVCIAQFHIGDTQNCGKLFSGP